jgi:hypothetical protein
MGKRGHKWQRQLPIMNKTCYKNAFNNLFSGDETGFKTLVFQSNEGHQNTTRSSIAKKIRILKHVLYVV